jgi:hypothetical protein
MRTETTTRTLYMFDELSDKAKDKAREWWRAGALDYAWWEFIFEDAESIGLKIKEFDLDRRLGATGEFFRCTVEVAERIKENHGETCETYATATAFLKERETFMDGAEKDEYGDLATYKLEGELEDIENDFLKSLLEDYAIMLQREHDYLLEDEQVDESIMSNDYEFTEDGKIA